MILLELIVMAMILAKTLDEKLSLRRENESLKKRIEDLLSRNEKKDKE